MNWSSIAGIASTMALLVPVVLILVYRLYRNGSLLVLSVYYLLTVVYNLMAQGYVHVSPLAESNFGALINYLDAPMMLVVLLYFCNLRWHKWVIYTSLAVFLIYEVNVLLYQQFSFTSNIYVLGPGTLMILAYCIFLFVQYGKASIVLGKGLGLAMMLAGFLFVYGSFFIIYLLHYIQKTPAVADVFLVYYIATVISSTLISAGLVWVYKRSRQIQEVQLTRKELAFFFNHQNA